MIPKKRKVAESRHRVIAQDKCLLASTFFARSLRTLRSKIKTIYFETPNL